MNDYLKTYKITLTALGPIFIGSGRTIGKKEYIFDSQKNMVYVPDLNKMYSWIIRTGYQKKYLDFTLNDIGKQSLYSWLFQNRISEKVWKEWIAYKLDSASAVDDTHSAPEINTFMKDAYNMVYIPGSSLKGAIRTALMGSAIYSNPVSFSRLKRDVENAEIKKRNFYLSKENNNLNAEVFNTANRIEKKYNMVNDCMAGLRISDSKSISTDNLILCRKFDEFPKGGTKKPNVMRECIRPGTKIEFDMTIDTKLFKKSEKDILNAINLFGKSYMECFNSKFISGDKLQNGMFYLGGGSGYVSKTVTYQLLGKDSVKTVSKIIDATLSFKAKKDHKHFKDATVHGISPHMIKKTVYNRKKYSFGLCKIEFEEI